MKNIAIFASGSGTNAEQIVLYFKNHQEIKVSLILSNNKNAFVLERAKKLNIPNLFFKKNDIKDEKKFLGILKKHEIDFIVLAGYLCLVPNYLIKKFPNKIVNIHPALLPKYGGKGMYGIKVHETIINNKEKESGISIHFVNEKYDEGQIIFQAKCNISENETAESLSKKIHKLEHQFYPQIIEKIQSSIF